MKVDVDELMHSLGAMRRCTEELTELSAHQIDVLKRYESICRQYDIPGELQALLEKCEYELHAGREAAEQLMSLTRHYEDAIAAATEPINLGIDKLYEV